MTAVTLIDGYKLDHRRQYPDHTEYVYSNWTPRSSRIEGVDSVVFLGLQYFLEHYLETEFGKFFAANIDDVCDEYEAFVNGYLGPNTIGTQHIRDLHSVGYLPLEFKALPEGTLTPIRVPMLTVTNTDPRFGWLVNYLETLMSSVLWMPSTSATIARRMRILFEEYAVKTGSPLEFVPFQGHDFSFRGMAGVESACLSGIGHLSQFVGTDTIPAIEWVNKYYGPLPEGMLVGASVAATEHSVMCAGGADDEAETYARLLGLYPAGILSVVSDTWDLWKVLTETVPALKDTIMARDGKLVIRPDSGDPEKILCGTSDYDSFRFTTGDATPEEMGVVEILWGIFGGTITETGHRMLDSHVGVIYGDAINFGRAKSILANLERQGFASANVVFGMGSYGYQYQTRDTFGFAMKATAVTIDGVETAIFKKPVTDNGEKFSAKGRVAVYRDGDGRLQLISEATQEQQDWSLLHTVWKDGKFVHRVTWDEVRANARA